MPAPLTQHAPATPPLAPAPAHGRTAVTAARAAATLCALLTLSGCAQLSSLKLPWPSSAAPAPASRRTAERPRTAPASPAATVPEEEPQTSASLHAEGLRLYRAGEYEAAIARFAAVQSPPSLRVQALKHMAFSYCITDRLSDCERAFRQALAMAPDFRLTQAEQGHPVWGPVFTKALQASSGVRPVRR
ncbi:MAG: TssQ family T6SS-associated lipoprotein [Pseudomonadota bacterium]|nr:TssQ family T6SS-associated lipoprotein [Pseudomonadota bacterium]